MTDEVESENPTLEIPEDDEFLNRDFFAYGIFKKGQIAHWKIKKYTQRIEQGETNHKMLLRDGVPIISEDESSEITKGDKIHFFDESKKAAYQAISDSESKSLFRWGTVKIDGIEFNALIGRRPSRGSSTHVDMNMRADILIHLMEERTLIFLKSLNSLKMKWKKLTIICLMVLTERCTMPLKFKCAICYYGLQLTCIAV